MDSEQVNPTFIPENKKYFNLQKGGGHIILS